jgi:ribosomal protein L28
MRKCQICEKGYRKAIRRVKLRGHFNPTTKHKQKANLQWFRLESGKRIKICMDCRRKILKGEISKI